MNEIRILKEHLSIAQELYDWIEDLEEVPEGIESGEKYNRELVEMREQASLILLYFKDEIKELKKKEGIK